MLTVIRSRQFHLVRRRGKEERTLIRISISYISAPAQDPLGSERPQQLGVRQNVPAARSSLAPHRPFLTTHTNAPLELGIILMLIARQHDHKHLDLLLCPPQRTLIPANPKIRQTPPRPAFPQPTPPNPRSALIPPPPPHSPRTLLQRSHPPFRRCDRVQMCSGGITSKGVSRAEGGGSWTDSEEARCGLCELGEATGRGGRTEKA